jgi:molecular chaperone DnaK
MERDEFAVGIDLGTTNSVVAVVRANRVEVIPDAEGQTLYPSIVSFKPNGDMVVGNAARLRRVVDPQNTIASAKRIIGQPFRSPDVQAAIAQLSYKVVEGSGGEPLIETRGKRRSVIEIAGHVLASLREHAEAYLEAPVTRCVITVPANFSDAQRDATRRAGELAGFGVLRILNEPTAAALAYGIGGQLDQRIVVFDMGGGTFDVTLLAVRSEMFEVLGTGGDSFLGGDDMDRALADVLALELLKSDRVDPRDDPKGRALLRIAAEQIKTQLGTETEVTGTLNHVATGGDGAPLSLSFRVTRAQFEELVTPLVDRALVKCEEVLAEAGVMADHVDEVILVGGATRVPLIRRRVAEHFGREPRADIDPMKVVAAGAAIQASLLARPEEVYASRPLLIDVTPHALGVATIGGYTEVLIQKNEPIPVERTQICTTARDGQREVTIRVCQGSERMFASNTLLGELRLVGLRPGYRGEVQIEVTFLVDADGILQVSARDLGTNQMTKATLNVLGHER